MGSYHTHTQRLQAVQARDERADSYFVYGVLTTGVVCYPSCASRAAHTENMRFFNSVDEAVKKGFRYCKRCRTDLKPLCVRHRDLVVKACRIISDAEQLVRVDTLANELGVSRFHLQKLFKEYTGVSPKTYMQAIRAHRLSKQLDSQSTITQAIVDAGYDSVSSFYTDVHQRLGMNATTRRKGSNNIHIRFGFAESALGLLVVAQTQVGVCAVLFGESRETLIDDLSARFPQAQLSHDEADLQVHIQTIVKKLHEPHLDVDIPLDIRGTAFQERVWRALTKIPSGQTASYTEVAHLIDQPKAARAVAKACAANPLAVLVPCHRVLKGNGELSGYRWGVDKKQALLDNEKE